MIASDLLQKGIFKFTYNGVACFKCPFDYALYQKLLFDMQPDLVIEIGTNEGGSALYIADLLNVIGKGNIHTIDLEDGVKDIKVRQHPRIKLFQGGWQNYELNNTSEFKKIIVIDDGSHFYEDVLGVLNKFYNISHYIIVEDGVIDQMGGRDHYRGGPLKAVHDFLALNPEFEIDRNLCEFFGPNSTYNTDGYLKRKVSSSPMKLIASIFTPNSILSEKIKYEPLNIVDRSRYATCTAVVWLTEKCFAMLNLYGDKISVFLEEDGNFKLHQEVTNADQASLNWSEHITISPNKTLIAVCSLSPNATINLYQFDEYSKLINPKPILIIHEDHLIHNVRFTPDSKYLAYTTYSEIRSVNIYEITNIDPIKLTPVCIKPNYRKIKSKAINFTADGKFAIIAYCIGLVNLKDQIESSLACYRMNENGMLEEKVCEIYQSLGIEDIVFLKDDTHFIVSDQAHDQLVIYKFDKETGIIDDNPKYMNGSDMQLNFPHGMSISDDRKYLAVANYGDDKCNIYEI